MKKLIIFTGFVLLLFSVTIFGQSNIQIEKELIGHIKNIDDWSVYKNDFSEELTNKLYAENETFNKKLLKYTSENPATLKYAFPELSKHLFMATSEDGKLRAFSWDTNTGGTMHFFNNVFQWEDKKGKVYSKNFESESESEGDPKSFITDIFTLKTKKETVYLVASTAILATSHNAQSVRLYKIKGVELQDDVKLIKTAEGLTDNIGFQYNFFSVVDRPERPIRLFSFDKKTNSLKFPVVIEDEENPLGRVTDKFIVYKFNGKYFVKSK